MTPGLTPVREQGDSVEQSTVVEYWPSDLKVRRIAMSLWPEGLSPLLGVDLQRYRSYESGGRDSGLVGLVTELSDMETFISQEADALIDGAPPEGTVVLHAVVDQHVFVARYPYAHSELHRNAYPVSLQYVAVGRAAAELRRRGREVEVYRGERRFDLTAARLAVGLRKSEAAHLLACNAKSYSRAEQRGEEPGDATLGGLRDLDDFIADVAGRFEIVNDDDGVKVITIMGDQAEFEATYPEARFVRSGTPYPVRALRVAAGRRAGVIEADGQPVRIVIRYPLDVSVDVSPTGHLPAG